MREREEPMIQTIKAPEPRSQRSQLLNQVFAGKKCVIVEKSGIPVAAVISAEDLEQLRPWEQARAGRLKVVDEVRSAFRDVPDDELAREVDKAVAEARHELYGKPSTRRTA